LIGGGVAALALALSLVGLKVSQHAAWAHGTTATHRGAHMSGHGMAGGMAGGMANFCSAAEGAHFDKLAAYLKPELELNDAQEVAWNEFAAAWRQSEADLRESCETGESDAQGVGGLLARAEIQLSAGLTALRAVRPSFEQFYAALDSGQRRILDAFGHR
jgi:hypothetical protein